MVLKMRVSINQPSTNSKEVPIKSKDYIVYDTLIENYMMVLKEKPPLLQQRRL